MTDRFVRAFGRRPRWFVRAPGRVDIIGAHVDYNGGPVLVIAIDREIVLEVGPASDDVTTVVAGDLGETASWRTAGLQSGRDVAGRPLPRWARYPAGVMWALLETGLTAPAIDVYASGSLPIGAGLSSSAALEVAFAKAWSSAGGWTAAPMELARLCRRAENEYVGVACGLMDQFGSLFGRRDGALLLDCGTLDWQPVPIPSGVSLFVADTTTRRQLADGRLNERHDECMSALERIRALLPGVSALSDVRPQAFEPIASRLPEPERSRARHVVRECGRVRQVARCLALGDGASAGEAMNDSHRGARDDFDVSGPELEAMWQAANAQPGCLGGRAVGAGFAGCMVFLVSEAHAGTFAAETTSRFAAATGIVPDVFRVHAVDGASVADAAAGPR